MELHSIECMCDGKGWTLSQDKFPEECSGTKFMSVSKRLYVLLASPRDMETFLDRAGKAIEEEDLHVEELTKSQRDLLTKYQASR